MTNQYTKLLKKGLKVLKNKCEFCIFKDAALISKSSDLLIILNKLEKNLVLGNFKLIKNAIKFLKVNI